MYEFWMRLAYQKLIEKKKLTTIVRPGDRSKGQKKGIEMGEKALVKIIVKPGSEEGDIEPVFHQFTTRVKIASQVVKKIGEIKKNDLLGSSPDVQDKEAVKCHLGLIYNREFFDCDVVTIFHLEYL